MKKDMVKEAEMIINSYLQDLTVSKRGPVKEVKRPKKSLQKIKDILWNAGIAIVLATLCLFGIGVCLAAWGAIL